MTHAFVMFLLGFRVPAPDASLAGSAGKAQPLGWSHPCRCSCPRWQPEGGSEVHSLLRLPDAEPVVRTEHWYAHLPLLFPCVGVHQQIQAVDREVIRVLDLELPVAVLIGAEGDPVLRDRERIQYRSG